MQRAAEYERLLQLLELCSRSSDDSSGSSSSGQADCGEAASFDELTVQLVANQRKWGRLLEAYETELLVACADDKPAVPRSLSPAERLGARSLSPAERLGARRESLATVGEGTRKASSPNKGFSFRRAGSKHCVGEPLALAVNNGSAPLFLRTRCESL